MGRLYIFRARRLTFARSAWSSAAHSATGHQYEAAAVVCLRTGGDGRAVGYPPPPFIARRSAAICHLINLRPIGPAPHWAIKNELQNAAAARSAPHFARRGDPTGGGSGPGRAPFSVGCVGL